MNRPPTPVDFDTSDRPSMGDPEFVDGLVREMLDEARKALLEAPTKDSNPQEAWKSIAEKYGAKFYAGCTEYVQTMTPEAQVTWLQEHGLGTEDTDPTQPAVALAAETLKRFAVAIIPFAEGQIDEEQLQFQLDAAVEDCVCMLLGIENPAD